MSKKNCSNEELREALEYFEKVDSLEKGAEAEDFDTSAETNGGKEEKITLLKNQREEYLAKAEELQKEISELEGKEEDLEKGCGMKKSEEDLEKPKEEFKEKPKKETNPQESMEEMKKSIKTEILGEIKDSYDELLKSRDNGIVELKNKIESLENEPLRKSKTTSDVKYFEKAFSGERTEDNNKVLSKRLHKGVISQILFEAWNRETDEVRKAKYSDAVMQFESANSFISEEIKEDLVKSHNIQIID